MLQLKRALHSALKYDCSWAKLFLSLVFPVHMHTLILFTHLLFLLFFTYLLLFLHDFVCKYK